MAHHSLRTITATEMRSINRSAVLDHIRRNSPVARSVIARVLKLSLPAVMRIVDVLVSAGWVRPTGKKEWSSGRRRDPLEYNKEGHAVVGIDLGGTKMVGALANIGGEILHELTINRHGTSGVSLIPPTFCSPPFRHASKTCCRERPTSRYPSWDAAPR